MKDDLLEKKDIHQCDFTRDFYPIYPSPEVKKIPQQHDTIGLNQ